MGLSIGPWMGLLAGLATTRLRGDGFLAAGPGVRAVYSSEAASGHALHRGNYLAKEQVLLNGNAPRMNIVRV